MGGGGWQFAWGPQDDEQSIRAIHHALDLGMNWIDTAAVYGIGHSEEVVGRALKGRSKPLVFTKCSRVKGPDGLLTSSLKRDSVRAECEGSLKRLGIDVIDLYQIHRGAPDEDIEEGWTAMAELQREGKVRWIGVSNFTVNQMQRCHAIAPITSLQPPYSLINRDIEGSVLPFCSEHKIGTIVYSPMASGLLTGTMTRERIASLPEDDWRSRSDAFKEPALTRNLAIADKLGSIAAEHGRWAGEAAIAWTLRHPAVTAAIVGIRSAEQADGVIGAMNFRLTDAEAAELEAI